MLVAALALFALAAIVGVYMLTRLLRNELPPWLAAVIHGAFAATGLVLLIYTLATSGVSPAPVLFAAAVILVIAALAGFLLVSFHARKKAPPRALAFVHAAAAIAGFLTLAASTLGVA